MESNEAGPSGNFAKDWVELAKGQQIGGYSPIQLSENLGGGLKRRYGTA
jgi:hypothetical protein